MVKAGDGPNGMRDGNQTQDMPYSVGSSTPRAVDVWYPLRLHDQRLLVLRGGILSTRPVVGTNGMRARQPHTAHTILSM